MRFIVALRTKFAGKRKRPRKLAQLKKLACGLRSRRLFGLSRKRSAKPKRKRNARQNNDAPKKRSDELKKNAHARKLKSVTMPKRLVSVSSRRH